MEEQCKSNDRPLLEDMRLVAGMMRMGERIAFGRDADLMERAAETIVGHQYEVENLESDKDSLRERIAQLETALRQIISPSAWSEIEPDTQAAYDLKRQKVEMQLIAAEALQAR